MKKFRVLRDYKTRKEYGDWCPSFLDWDIVEPHRRQAERNHYQSLETLNNRGGLGIEELYAVLRDKPYEPVDERVAIEYLRKRIEDHQR